MHRKISSQKKTIGMTFWDAVRNSLIASKIGDFGLEFVHFFGFLITDLPIDALVHPPVHGCIKFPKL